MVGSGDFELLVAWREGDREAGDELVRRNFDVLYRFFSNKLPHACDDMIQRTFVRALERSSRLDGVASFRAYLLAIARNLFFDELRGHARQPDRVDFTQLSMRDLGTSATSKIARSERADRLLTALRGIPIEYQLVLELAYWEHLDGPEIAAVVGIPANTVRSRLVRARRALKERLELAHV